MSYSFALEEAGAKVFAYSKFGDYQGTWAAKVCYKGKYGWVFGYYGSCSECDYLEGELADGKTYKQIGEEFLSGTASLITQEEMEKEANKGSGWDFEKRELIDFVLEHKYINPVDVAQQRLRKEGK